MIKRDEHGIIVQHSKSDLSYGDGGDSAMRSSVMALCGSGKDLYNLPMFNTPSSNQIVRHPYQSPWNNPNNCTRDQLMCYAAAAAPTVVKRLFYAAIKRGFRAQNTEFDVPGSTKLFPNGADILSPSDMLFLAVCANANISITCLLATIGIPWFILDLLFATRVKPWDEQNQMVCKCLVFGRLVTKFYVWLHPDYKKSISTYWCGWRDQAEIYDAIVAKVESVIK